jgi:CheY-like chemotaxis protein
MSRSLTGAQPAQVLIVDDVPANLDLLYQTLAMQGHAILAAASGEVALRVAHNSRPDLILLDVLMPGLDG